MKSTMISHPLNLSDKRSIDNHYNHFKKKTIEDFINWTTKSKEKNYNSWKNIFNHSYIRITIK